MGQCNNNDNNSNDYDDIYFYLFIWFYFQDLVHHLTFIEQTMAKAQSLLEKLRHVDPSHTVSDLDLQRFVSDLMEFPEVSISTSDDELPSKTHLGALVHRFFLNAYKVMMMMMVLNIVVLVMIAVMMMKMAFKHCHVVNDYKLKRPM